MISLSEWSKLEQHGAVFLSAAGLRMAVPTNLSDQIDDFIYDVGSYGNYWSASVYDDEEAWVLKFGDAIYTPVGSYSRGYGCSVRLVCDVH